MKKPFSEIESATLRRQADKRLGERSTPLGADEIDTQRLLHELRVRQIELEMQNEQLRHAHAETEAALQQFAALNERLERRITKRTGELLLARDAAEAANRAKSAFLANMNHEFRTPMSEILGMTHVLRASPLNSTQAGQLAVVETCGSHLLGLIDEVLDLATVEAGSVELENQDFNLHETMHAIAAAFIDDVLAKGLALRLDLSSLPASVHGDSNRLRQALANYVGNALKFTEHGTIALSGRIVEQDSTGYLLRFEVQDSGVGVAPEALPRLFTAFEQADNSIARKFGGAGLGLVITRHIARLMGGDAGASRGPGIGNGGNSGSTFWLTARFAKAGQ